MDLIIFKLYSHIILYKFDTNFFQNFPKSPKFSNFLLGHFSIFVLFLVLQFMDFTEFKVFKGCLKRVCVKNFHGPFISYLNSRTMFYFYTFCRYLNRLFYEIENILHYEKEGRTVTPSTWLGVMVLFTFPSMKARKPIKEKNF